MPLRPDIIERLNRMSERDFKAWAATTDLMMLAGEGEPDPEKRIERGASELRSAYFLARNAKAGVKFVAGAGAVFFAALQWGHSAWMQVKVWAAWIIKGGA